MLNAVPNQKSDRGKCRYCGALCMVIRTDGVTPDDAGNVLPKSTYVAHAVPLCGFARRDIRRRKPFIVAKD